MIDWTFTNRNIYIISYHIILHHSIYYGTVYDLWFHTISNHPTIADCMKSKVKKLYHVIYYIYIYILYCVCEWTFTHIPLYPHIHTPVHTYIFRVLSLCFSVCLSVSLCIHRFTWIYTHIYIYVSSSVSLMSVRTNFSSNGFI